jgi:hypothetical protein
MESACDCIGGIPASFHRILATKTSVKLQNSDKTWSTRFALHLKHPLRDFGALLGLTGVASRLFSITAGHWYFPERLPPRLKQKWGSLACWAVKAMTVGNSKQLLPMLYSIETCNATIEFGLRVAIDELLMSC